MAAFFLLIMSLTPARGEDLASDLLPLGLSAEGSETVTTSRSPRPISRIAENVTVITADQIALLNPHTLIDILQTIPGIQIQQSRTPGSWTPFSTKTLDFNHVLIFIDGIAQNDLLNNFPDAALIPAQQIERIEIIKGAASSAWGAAMGGVVNVITKSGNPEKRVGGVASATYGEKGTSDLNVELGGTENRFGYYLAGGNLHSRGLLPGNGINFNHAWGKFEYDLPNRGHLTVGGNIREAFRGLEESAELNYRDTDEFRYHHLFADYSHPLTEHLILDLSARHRRQWNETILGSIVYDPLFPDWVTTIRQTTSSGSARIRWDKTPLTALAGIDYEHHNILKADGEELVLNRWATYLNGSYNAGALTLLPGIRFDHTALGRNPTTYTLGATYRLTEKTLIRGYSANGYSLANTILVDNIQKIKTIQVGIESNDISFLWLKATCFYNSLSNMPLPEPKQTRQGFEIEARTVPLNGLSFSGGYTFAHSRDDSTDERIMGAESQSLKAAVYYKEDNIGFSGTLTGNYVWWNADSTLNPHYTPMVWNLHLTQKVKTGDLIATELFFSGYNLFNGSQYTSDLFKNTRRWLEGGVRFRF